MPQFASRRGFLACLTSSLRASELPVRLAISESMVADVNMNDARAAMLIWIKRMTVDLKMVVEFNPKAFDTSEEIVNRARAGRLDAVALNVIEFRQIADVLDASQVVAEAGGAGPEQYVLLTKRNNQVQELSHLKGRRLCVLKAPKMCVANAWLASILDEGHFGPPEQFFGSMATDSKVSRVVLPVFFGQAEACITTKRSFETMCELNPQLSKDLVPIASSPPMVVAFYVFHKNFHDPNRERFIKVLSELRSSAAGRQLATLFQFEELTIRDASCLTSALTILDSSDRAHKRWGRKV